MAPRTAIVLVFAAATALFAAELFGFFHRLNTTLSGSSSGDIAYHVQLFHNFASGKPFQTSLVRGGYGVLSDTFPYANQGAYHSNFSPYLFTPLYALFPGINGLYALVIGVNLMSVVLFGAWFLRRFSTDDVPFKTLAFIAVISTSHFFRTASYQAHMILFGTPFFFAAHFAALRGSRLLFWPAILALCLVAEEAAMFAVTYSAYLILFEKNARRLGLRALALAAAVLAADVLVLMPAARSGMVVDHASFLSWALSTRPALASGFRDVWIEIWPVLPLFPVLIAAACARRFEERESPAKLLGLVFLAPLSHWLIAYSLYGAHHLMPILWCLIAAFLSILSADPSPRMARPQWQGLTAGFALLFALAEARSVDGRTFARALTSAEFDAQRANRNVIDAIRRIPEERTVVYSTSPSAEGFFAARQRLWRYPAYYDLADDLVVQRSASDPSSVSRADALVKELRDIKKSHVVVEDAHDYVVLRREQRHPFPEPRSSIGLRYLAD